MVRPFRVPIGWDFYMPGEEYTPVSPNPTRWATPQTGWSSPALTHFGSAMMQDTRTLSRTALYPK